MKMLRRLWHGPVLPAPDKTAVCGTPRYYVARWTKRHGKGVRS